jgi:hypothetical protein
MPTDIKIKDGIKERPLPRREESLLYDDLDGTS